MRALDEQLLTAYIERDDAQAKADAASDRIRALRNLLTGMDLHAKALEAEKKAAEEAAPPANPAPPPVELTE